MKFLIAFITTFLALFQIQNYYCILGHELSPKETSNFKHKLNQLVNQAESNTTGNEQKINLLINSIRMLVNDRYIRELKEENNLLTQVNNVETDVNDMKTQIKNLKLFINENIGQIQANLSSVQDQISSVPEEQRIKDFLQVKNDSGYDCCTLKKSGYNVTGVYRIEVMKTFLEVQCDMETEGGGWTVIQRRTLDGISVNFTNKKWVDYENGFGIVPKSYWLGLKYIHALTDNVDQEIRFDIETFREIKREKKAYAKYGHFFVAGPEDKYRLIVDDFSGTAGNSLSYHNGMQFTTIDKDNDLFDRNCAIERKGGWWHNSCLYAHPNGVQHPLELRDYSSIMWYEFLHGNTLKYIDMKIRNKNPELCGIR